jgi:hypothetical protein
MWPMPSEAIKPRPGTGRFVRAPDDRSADRRPDRRAVRAREQLIAEWLRRLDPSRADARRSRR